MKTILKAALVATSIFGIAAAQAQVTVNSAAALPSGYESLGNTDPADVVISRLPAADQAKAYIYNGQVYLPKHDVVATGVASGSAEAASATASGSTATLVAVGIGVFAVIGAVVAGSSDNNNGSTSTTSTTSTH